MVVAAHGAENVISLFADTCMEDPDLYRFLDDIHAKFNVPITRIADGRNPFEVSRDRKYMANSRKDVCSDMLKRKPMDRWVKKNFKPDECVCYIGIDASEEHRIVAVTARKLPYRYESPLVSAGIWVDDVFKKKWCEDHGIELPYLYKLGFPHNNCGGMCVKAGLGQFKLLWDKLPERYMWFEEQQETIMKDNPKLRPFLSKTIDKVKHYMSMKEYREAYLMPDSPMKLTIDDEIDLGGCGCAVDDSGEEEQDMPNVLVIPPASDRRWLPLL